MIKKQMLLSVFALVAAASFVGEHATAYADEPATSTQLPQPDPTFNGRIAETYDKSKADFSQAEDLADQHPAKLKELKAKFLEEAKKYSVLPLDPRFAERFDPKIRVGGTPPTSWTYYGNNRYFHGRH
jgi:hypothetical protein